MYNAATTTLYFSNTLQQVCSAIITIGNEKPEYTILEEVSPCELQLSVNHTSKAFNKKRWYYLKIVIRAIHENYVLANISAEAQQNSNEDAAQHLDKQSILKEFVFILKHFLAEVE